MSIDEISLQEIQGIFQKQKENRINLANSSANERKAKLKKLLSLLIDSQNEICEAVYKDLRKSNEETKLTEIFAVTTEIRYAMRKLRSWTKPKRVRTPLSLFGTSNSVMYESIGQSLIISPWNYPFQLAVGPLVHAISAGNTVIVKPSEKSPYTSNLLKKMMEGIFSENEVKVITGGVEVSKMLISLPFNHIFFTGSPNIGKKIMEAASKNLTKITLELGGKSPTIIHHDADLKPAALRIAWGKFMNAGQTCVAPDYLLVHESIKEKIIEEVIKETKCLYGEGDLLKRENNYCRMINSEHLTATKHLLDESIKNGANILLGGDIDENDNFISPTIVDNVSLDSSLMTSEIFGPLLPVISYSNEEEIFEVIERNPNPLALYVFSKNKKFIRSILKKVPAGSSAVNDVVIHFANHNLPFGGINNSGIGKSHGYYGFKAFSNEKSIMKQRKISSMIFFYPPYNKLKNKLIDIVIKYL